MSAVGAVLSTCQAILSPNLVPLCYQEGSPFKLNLEYLWQESSPWGAVSVTYCECQNFVRQMKQESSCLDYCLKHRGVACCKNAPFKIFVSVIPKEGFAGGVLPLLLLVWHRLRNSICYDCTRVVIHTQLVPLMGVTDRHIRFEIQPISLFGPMSTLFLCRSAYSSMRICSTRLISAPRSPEYGKSSFLSGKLSPTFYKTRFIFPDEGFLILGI